MNRTIGQSAIEYLMTYGWMLLVVAIAGGTIFSVVGNQSIESISGFNGEDITIENFGVNNGRISFEVRNTGSKEVEINSVKLKNSEIGASIKSFPRLILGVGESDILELEGIETTESTEKSDLTIDYNSGSLENLSIEGTVTGSLKIPRA